MKVVGVIVSAQALLLMLFLVPVFGLFGLLAGTAAEVQEQGPLVPPELEAAYRQVAAETNRDWTILAAWDGADNGFSLPVRSEQEILNEQVDQEEAARQEEADRRCRALPPNSICPPPRELSAADLERVMKSAHRQWYGLVLSHIRGHADQITEADASAPEPFFDRVLPSTKAQKAAELQMAYAVLQEMGDDDHTIETPAGGPPPGWTPVDGFAWPASGPLTSRYGMRTSPIDGQRRLHAGIDIGINTGTPIRASKEGIVTRAEYDQVYGLVVVIDHGDGYSSLYAHNSRLEVIPGQHVQQGQEVSRSGSTGLSTGPHLHFEIHYRGVPVDPMLLLGR